MSNYRTTQYVDEEGTKYIFVTRGKSAPVTNEEILTYISRERPIVSKEKLPIPVQAPAARDVAESLARQFLKKGQFVDTPAQMCQDAGEPIFEVPEEREKIFLADLRRGIPFCIGKYGATENLIVEEAHRIFPSLNLTKLWEKPNGTQGKTS